MTKERRRLLRARGGKKIISDKLVKLPAPERGEASCAKCGIKIGAVLRGLYPCRIDGCPVLINLSAQTTAF